MSDTRDGETNDQLIAAAAAHGYTVTKRQLAEWHRAGLLPEPQQVFGQRAGSTSQYPVGTTDRLLALCALRKQRRRDADVAWGLWWAGYDVPEEYMKAPTEQAAAEWTREVQELRELLGRATTDQSDDAASEELPDAFFDFLEKTSSARISNKVVAQARKRLGRERHGGERFQTLIRVLIEVITGTFTGYTTNLRADAKDAERALVEKGLGLTRARTDRLAEAGPWLTGDTEESLRALSDVLQQYPPGYGLDVVTLDELARTRDEVKLFVAMFAGWSTVAEQMFGRGAFGLAAFTPLAGDERPDEQAMWLLLWRTLRKSDVGSAIELFMPIVQQWQQTIQPTIDATQQLRVEVPATADLLDPKQIGRGLRNTREEERRLARLRALHDEHAAELDAFFAAHPEVRIAEPEPSQHTPPADEGAGTATERKNTHRRNQRKRGGTS